MELNETQSDPGFGIGMKVNISDNSGRTIIEDYQNKTGTNIGVLLTTLVPDTVMLSPNQNVSSQTPLRIEDVRVTTTLDPILPTSSTFDELNEPDPETIAFVLIPLFLIVAVALLSGLGLLWMSKRRKLDRLRHRLIPMYTFSPGEDEEWGVLIDHTHTRDH